MPNYRRNYRSGGVFFFTVVTAGRAPLFSDENARQQLGACLREERRRRPFRVDAIVLLPNHLHTLWTLPEGDAEFSIRWSSIKGRFTRTWLAEGGCERPILPGHQRERRRGVWQARFFEHTIRDEEDFRQHVEYIHYNPVKHGYVRSPREWPWSSFSRYVKQGDYPVDWGCGQLVPSITLDEDREEWLEQHNEGEPPSL